MPKISEPEISCPVCGLSDNFITEACGANDFRECQNCGLEFAYPMQPGGEDYYEESYGALEGGYGANKWEFVKFLIDAQELNLKGKLLEVACGPGHFLRMAKNRGFEVYGLDFNKLAVEYAQQSGLGDVQFGDIANMDSLFPGIKFDIVILFSILEHLDKPQETIDAIKARLAKDGILAIVTPNRKRSILKFNLRERREGWDYEPHHMTRWDKGSISYFLTDRGFKDISIKEQPVQTLKEIFEFARGIVQLWTATGIAARMKRRSDSNAAAQLQEVSANLNVYILRFLSRVKGFMANLAAVVILPFCYLASKLHHLKGTNLYVLARNK